MNGVTAIFRYRSVAMGWKTPCERTNFTSWFTKIKTGSHLAQVQGGTNKGFRSGPFQNSPVHNAPSVPSPRKHSYYYATPVPVPILFILFWYSLDALPSSRISALFLKLLKNHSLRFYRDNIFNECKRWCARNCN